MAPVRKRRMVWQRVTSTVSKTPSMASSPCAECDFGKVTKANDDKQKRAATTAALVPAKSLSRTHSDEHLEEIPDSTSTSCTEGGHLSGNEASMDSSSETSSPRTSTHKITADVMLRVRRYVLKTESNASGKSKVSPWSVPGRLTSQRRPLAADGPSAGPWRPKALSSFSEQKSSSTQHAHQQQQLPAASPNSWAQAQRERRKTQELEAQAAAGASTGEAVPDTPSAESVARRVKSILNKLTPEKFATLYVKLMDCGICEVTHMEMLARVIFDEAVVQHKFTHMYADLCMCALSDFSEEVGAAFGEQMLGHCMSLLDSSLEQPGGFSSPKGVGPDEDAEAAEEARAQQKKRAIGNVRFIGELLIRNLIEPSVLFSSAERFMTTPSEPHKLEMLATLLTVVGPVLDNSMWPHQADLLPVFWHVRGLTFDSTIPKRVRCLLRDLVELRDAGWIDESVVAKQNSKPMMLDEVRNGPSQDLMQDAASAEWMAMADFGEGVFSSWDADNAMDYSDYSMMTYGDEGIPPMAKADSQGTTTCSFDSSPSALSPGGKHACSSDVSDEGV